ncbi:MAG: hypothetical protein ACRD0G_14770 [Acidimicrobiales bacterium]
MSARRIGIVAAVVTMLASGAYVFVYLDRWEWNRAQVSGMIFLAAEVGVIGVAMMGRLGAVERRLDRMERERHEPDPRVLERLRESAPPPHEPFGWLTKSPNRTNVFVPVLLGAGVVLSAVAWLVERIARATVRPSMERGLARELASLAPPSGGLLGRDDPPDLLSPLKCKRCEHGRPTVRAPARRAAMGRSPTEALT